MTTVRHESRFCKKLFAAVAMLAVGTAFAADDMTVPYGETLNITANTTYSNLVVNGTLNVAQGVKLTCDTFVLGDNLDHTLDKVAKMTVASNATVTVNNADKMVSSHYTYVGYCKIGNNSRAELTLEGGSTFTAGGTMILASACTGTAAKVVFVKVKINDATLGVNGVFSCRGSHSENSAIENTVVELNGPKALLNPCYVQLSGAGAEARIKFNGGKLSCSGWYNWGNQSVLDLISCKQKLWVESVDGNAMYLSCGGGSNTHAFFYNSNPWPNSGISQINFVGSGPLVLDAAGTVPLCWTSQLATGVDYSQLTGVRIAGGGCVTFSNMESYRLGTNLLKNVKLSIAAGAKFDVCGISFGIGSLESAGLITNSSVTCSVVTNSTLTVGGTNGKVVLSSNTIGTGVKLVKVGTGKLLMPATQTGDIDVSGGTFDFCDRAAVGFPYYRYWVYGKSKGGGDSGGHCSSVKLSEIQLYQNGTSVRDQVTDVTWSRYGSSDKTPTNLLEDGSNTYWHSGWYALDEGSNYVFAAFHFGGAAPYSFKIDTREYTRQCDSVSGAPLCGDVSVPISSYKYRLHTTEWYSYTNPEYFRFQGGLGDDTWVDLEDWQARGRYAKLNHASSYKWSEEFALAYPVNPVTVGNLTVAAGTTWTVDCLQADLTIDSLSLGNSGTLAITNHAAALAAGKINRRTLPIRIGSIADAGSFKGWTVTIDGKSYPLGVALKDGRLGLVSTGLIVLFR